MMLITIDKIDYKPIPNYPGLWVSNNGVVIANRRNPNKPNVLAINSDKYGYSYFTHGGYPGRKRKWMHVHQAVLLAWVGPRTGHDSRHLNGNKEDNFYKNLAWGTVVENGKDKAIHGIHKGIKNNQAKMTPEIVMSIRELYGLMSIRHVHKIHFPEFSFFAVWAAASGYTWGHLPGAITKNRKCYKGSSPCHSNSKTLKKEI